MFKLTEFIQKFPNVGANFKNSTEISTFNWKSSNSTKPTFQELASEIINLSSTVEGLEIVINFLQRSSFEISPRWIILGVIVLEVTSNRIHYSFTLEFDILNELTHYLREWKPLYDIDFNTLVYFNQIYIAPSHQTGGVKKINTSIATLLKSNPVTNFNTQFPALDHIFNFLKSQAGISESQNTMSILTEISPTKFEEKHIKDTKEDTDSNKVTQGTPATRTSDRKRYATNITNVSSYDNPRKSNSVTQPKSNKKSTSKTPRGKNIKPPIVATEKITTSKVTTTKRKSKVKEQKELNQVDVNITTQATPLMEDEEKKYLTSRFVDLSKENGNFPHDCLPDKKSPLVLPCPIRLETRHPIYGKVSAIAVLWYVDKFSPDYEQPFMKARSQSTINEYYKLQSDDLDPLEKEGTPDLLPVRVCFFHSIVEVYPATSPLIILKGRFFSSLNVSASLLGTLKSGFDAWSVLTDVPEDTNDSKSSTSISKWTMGLGKRFSNHPYLCRIHKFPKTNVEEILCRDLLASLCVEECDEHRCTSQIVAVPCKHRIRHQLERQEIDPDDVDWNEDLMKKKRHQLDLQYISSPWGLRVTFTRLKQVDVTQSLKECDFWYEKLFQICKQVISSTWPIDPSSIILLTHPFPMIPNNIVESVAGLNRILEHCIFRPTACILAMSTPTNKVITTVDEFNQCDCYFVRFRIKDRENPILTRQFEKYYSQYIYANISGDLLIESKMVESRDLLNKFKKKFSNDLTEKGTKTLEEQVKQLAVDELKAKDIVGTLHHDCELMNGEKVSRFGLTAPQFTEFWKGLIESRKRLWRYIGRGSDIVDNCWYSIENQTLFKLYEQALYIDTQEGGQNF